ncbi:MAG TPA: GNAT family N-acetyltransferase [Candidatus Binataceae bacterium]|nr:GNAT family N-acetyltransferase [Candidatus Binataceae bacterium]
MAEITRITGAPPIIQREAPTGGRGKMAGQLSVRRLTHVQVGELRPVLAELLRDAVASGASVGFLAPISDVESLDYWRGIEAAVRSGSRIVLAGFDSSQLVGSAQLELATMPNARHRAEVMKLFVFRSSRRKGIGRALMNAIEQEARAAKRSLLVLDTRRGDPAEKLYLSLGYKEAGRIPGYARSSDGTLHETVLMYKQLPPGGPVR